MSKRALSLLLSIPSIAVAQPAVSDQPAAAPIATPPVTAMAEPAGGPPETGFQLQARMDTQLGVSSVITPGFSAGYRTGNIVIGAELGLIAGQLNTDTTKDTFSLFHLMPMIYFDFWKSDDGRARLDLVGGAGIGSGKLTSTGSMGTTSESTATFLPLLAGIGGDYYLHRNFALGVEAGFQLPILLSVKDNGTDQHLSGGLESLHGMIRFTFVAGR